MMVNPTDTPKKNLIRRQGIVYITSTEPEVVFFSYSTHLSMDVILLIDIKMSIIIDILIYMSRIINSFSYSSMQFPLTILIFMSRFELSTNLILA